MIMVLQQIDPKPFMRFWKPQEGNTYTIDIVGAEHIVTDFNETRENKVDALRLSITRVDNLEFDEPVEWTTAAQSFIPDYLRIHNWWSQPRWAQKVIRVQVTYSKDRKYTVHDKTEDLASPEAVRRVMRS